MEDKTICITGHRPNKLPWGLNEEDSRCIKFKQDLEKIIVERIKLGYTHFISGLALGVDTYFAEIILKLKNEYKSITLEGAIPCENQTYKWSIKSTDKYNEIKNKCDKITLISKNYTPYCMIQRNRYMVENSSLVIAVYSGAKGGTHNTVTYAKQLNREIITINPSDY